MIRRCVGEEETCSILQQCHRMINGGHFGPQRIAAKILEVGFFWPTLFHHARKFVLICDAYQRSGNISKMDEMLQSGILEVEIFDVWGIDFIGPFLFQMEISIYLFMWITYPSGWKLKHAQ